MSKILFRQIELVNGLKAIISENDNIPSVILSLSYKAGAKDEPPGKKGLAHLLEHLMFTGSYGENNKSFDELLNRMGGDSNAFTSYDMTSYYLSVPSGMLEYAMMLDSERLRNLDFSEENINLQKKVVTEEKAQIYDNAPYGSLEFECNSRLFKDTPYETPVIGRNEDINTFTGVDIVEFFRRFYNSGNAVLTVCGDIDIDKIESLLNKYYSAIQNGITENVTLDFEMKNSFGEKIIVYDKVHLPAVFMNFRLPEFGTVQYYAARYIAGMLTGGDSSLLKRKIVFENNFCYEVESSAAGFEKAGVFGIDAYLNDNVSCSQVENEILNIIDYIAKGKFTDGDIEKIKNKIELSYHTSLQTNLSVADNFSFFALFTESPDRINYEIENALRITRDDIIETAVDYLNRDKMLLFNYLPEAEYAG